MNDILYQAATLIIPLVIAIVFHEVAHGWMANYFGDPTAKSLGRLTFNPVKHVDPVGTVVLPGFLALVGAPVFGWAKPVPVVPNRMRNPRFHMMAVAFAGPGMNFLLAFVAVAGMAAVIASAGQGVEFSTAQDFLFRNLFNFMTINIFLALFNLLPIPPFDGSHILEGALPRSMAAGYAKLRPLGMVLLIVLLLVVPMLFPDANIIERVVLPPVQWTAQFYLDLFGIR